MVVRHPTDSEAFAPMRIPIVIPAFCPDEKLLSLLESLWAGAKHPLAIIVVDDGSKEACAEIFQRAQQQYSCHVLTHAVNRGKGQALKTAFRYVLDNLPGCIGVVTADADGQHAAEDILACMRTLAEQPDHLVLGCRSFDGPEVPLKSRLGNRLTSIVLRMARGMHITDTQTGLRAIPRFFLEPLEGVPGERYEFEMNMLLECGKRRIPVKQVSIKTIYLEGNKASHFQPVFDSFKIYAVFLWYLLSSLASFLLDIGAFSLFVFLLKGMFPVRYIFVSTVLARACSSSFNYFTNKNLVFRAGGGKATAVKYYTLVLLQMIVSGILVTYVYTVFSKTGETSIKVVIDTLLFFLNFFIQRKWVFISKRVKKTV